MANLKEANIRAMEQAGLTLQRFNERTGGSLTYEFPVYSRDESNEQGRSNKQFPISVSPIK